jgi:hypothetical protein
MQAFAATWIAKRPPIAVGEDAPAASHEDSFIF